MIWTTWIGLGAILAALGVALGAFGAHALKARLTPEYLAVFETGVRYQMYHAFALIALGLVATRVESTTVKLAGLAFLGGILLFSGSLYILTLGDQKSWGMVTPFGGVLFIVGWILFAASVFRLSA